MPVLCNWLPLFQQCFLRWKFLINFAKKIFDKFDLCITSNKETENYLKILGAKNIKNFGNLKFSKTKSSIKNELESSLINKIRNRKIWVAASTHPTEEIFCAEAHLRIKKTFNNILTIIIPRHINRIKTISDELSNLNYKTTLYSNFDQINSETDRLLIDTYGEALKFYDIAKCVFLGKSLIESLVNDSGQNPIEPARLGCKIYHGPNVSNFSEIYEFLKSLNVSKEIRNSEELSQSLVEELKNNKTGDNQIVEKIENYGVNTLNNVLKEIKIYINTQK